MGLTFFSENYEYPGIELELEATLFELGYAMDIQGGWNLAGSIAFGSGDGRVNPLGILPEFDMQAAYLQMGDEIEPVDQWIKARQT